MKKNLLLSGLLMATVLYSSAQEKVKWGVQAGVNFANMSASASGINISFSSKAGIHAGVSAEIGIAPSFAFQPEIAYNNYGFKFNTPDPVTDFEGEEVNGELKTAVDYISVPLLLKYKVANTGLGIYAGPQLGFLVSAKESFNSYSEDAKESYKSVDFLAAFGAEYFLPQGIGLTARYQLGLTNTSKEIGEEGSVKNRVFTIALGYRF